MILPSVPPQHYATLPPHVWASFSLQKLDKIEAEVRKTWIDVWSDICLMIIANERLSPVRKLSKLRGHTVEVARQKQDELQTQGRRVTVNTDHCARVSWTTAGELCERPGPFEQAAGHITAHDDLHGQISTLKTKVVALQAELASRPISMTMGAAIKALQAENDRLKALSAKQTSV